MPDKPLDLSVAKAAQVLGVSAGTIRRWADNGTLPHYLTPGGQRRFNQEDLDRFVASLRSR